MATSPTDKLDRLLLRQEALVGSISGLADITTQTRDMVAELAAWLQQPPSNDLPNLITAMEKALTALTEAVVRVERKVDAMAAKDGASL